MSGIIKYLAIIILFTFSYLGIFGLNLSMKMDNGNHMSSCVFMLQDSGQCQMSISDHIAKWQETFSATAASDLVLILFVLLSLAIIYSITRYYTVDPPKLYLYQRFKKENDMIKLFDYLLQAMSSGILQSKVYA